MITDIPVAKRPDQTDVLVDPNRRFTEKWHRWAVFVDTSVHRISKATITFLGLGDTPDSYTGQANKVVSVKATEDGLEFTTPASGSGTVTTVSVVSANGVSGTVANATTTPAITLALGAITPTSVAASGTLGGSNFSGSSSGSNTGDQTLPTGANPTATAADTAVNGTATTFMRSDGAPAVQKGSSTAFGIVKVDGTTITATGGVISAVSGGSGTVTTTGSPASGNLSKFSGATSITNTDLTGDVATSGGVATTLATVNSNVGTFGDATHVAQVTVNAKGLVTGASSVAIVGTGSTTIIPPQGRLTLQSGSPVMTADQTAKATVYYDSFTGNQVPIYSGTAWSLMTIAADEISMGLDAVTPHVASGSLYDVFGLNNSGALVIAIGPAWSSSTSRGTGAGTAELVRQDGIWVNKNALTHAWGGASGTTDYGSVTAKTATYLGTIYATANGQTGMAFQPAAAAGGTNNFLGLYNAYNRLPISAYSRDNTTSWTYALATWRAADNSTSNRVSYVDGLATASIRVFTGASGFTGANAGRLTIGSVRDSTTASPANVGKQGTGGTSNAGAQLIAADSFFPALGFHFIQAMESATAAQTVTFQGLDSASNQIQGLTVLLEM